MPTVRKVSDIKSKLLRPATTSHFEVSIPLPGSIGSPARQIFKKWEGDRQDKINLMCSEASLPGSSLATFETNNDRTGVTERFVHRRIFDERIDLTFYVDAGLYQPIKFFEEWIDFITGAATSPERTEFVSAQENRNELLNPEYHYRMKYPNDYIAGQGMTITKFEKDPSPSQTQNGDRKYTSAELQYEFIRSYPLSITSMPVSYDGSSLLKCSVSMTYVRYIIHNLDKINVLPQSPTQQAQSNGGLFQ